MTLREELHARAEALVERETAAFVAAHPVSEALAAIARQNYPGGVPMHWMLDWETPVPLSIVSASGATIEDADGLSYADFCLGDSGALFGHSPPAVARAIADQAKRGLTAMLPGPDTAFVGQQLARLFGLPFWQTTATASDANRAVIRWARAITGRRKLLVFDGCYHGQVDETFARLEEGRVVPSRGLIGPIPSASDDTLLVPFNDLSAVEAALSGGDVALLLTEPALTNTGMVLPEPGFLEGIIAAARANGTLVAFDETHTISTGRGGHTGSLRLSPDFFVLGKPIAGGLPAAVYGFTAAIEAAMRRVQAERPDGYSGIGTTLSGNLLTMAAMRACLGEVMTEISYLHMTSLAATLADGLGAAIRARALPWCVIRLGARVELVFRETPPRNGAEAREALDPLLERALHLYLLNRGVIVTPFHNMMLVSPATTGWDVERLVTLMGEAFDILTGRAGVLP